MGETEAGGWGDAVYPLVSPHGTPGEWFEDPYGEVGYTFSIKQTGAGAYELVSTYPAGQHAKGSLLDELVWHRAAEAMLAHRKGHFEAYRNKLLRKPKRQDA